MFWCHENEWKFCKTNSVIYLSWQKLQLVVTKGQPLVLKNEANTELPKTAVPAFSSSLVSVANFLGLRNHRFKLLLGLKFCIIMDACQNVSYGWRQGHCVHILYSLWLWRCPYLVRARCSTGHVVEESLYQTEFQKPPSRVMICK